MCVKRCSSAPDCRLLGADQEALRAVPPSGEDDRQPGVLSRQHAGLPGHALRRPGVARRARPHSLRAGPAAVAHHQARAPSPSLLSDLQTFLIILLILLFCFHFILILLFLLSPQHLSRRQHLRQSVDPASPLSANPLHLPAPLPLLPALAVPSGRPALPSRPVPDAAALLGNQIS